MGALPIPGVPDRSLAGLLAVLLVACSSSPPATPVDQAPVDQVRAVLAGRVVDPTGAPVGRLARVDLTAGCAPNAEMDPCSVSTTRWTDGQGRFVASFERDWNRSFSAIADLEIRPPVGRGYDLGIAVRKGVELRYQPEPPADTTFVEITLPSQRSASRAPEWVERISHRALSRPIRADSRRVYLSDPGCVEARDRTTGALLWCEGSSSSLVGLPYLVVDEVVAMSRGEVFSGLDASSGEVLWTRTGAPNFPFVADEDHGIVATDGTAIAAYDPRTGATRWQTALDAGGRVTLAMGSGLVCAERLVTPPGNARIQCWDSRSGEHRWSRFIGSPAWVAIAADRVLLAGGEAEGESGWTGLDAETGETVWKAAVFADRGPALSDSGEVVFACSPAECVAVRTRDGSVLWRRALEGQKEAPAVAGGRVYVTAGGPLDRSLYVLEATTGAIRERIDPDPFDSAGFCASPSAEGNRVYVFSCGWHLYAFEVE